MSRPAAAAAKPPPCSGCPGAASPPGTPGCLSIGRGAAPLRLRGLAGALHSARLRRAPARRRAGSALRLAGVALRAPPALRAPVGAPPPYPGGTPTFCGMRAAGPAGPAFIGPLRVLPRRLRLRSSASGPARPPPLRGPRQGGDRAPGQPPGFSARALVRAPLRSALRGHSLRCDCPPGRPRSAPPSLAVGLRSARPPRCAARSPPGPPCPGPSGFGPGGSTPGAARGFAPLFFAPPRGFFVLACTPAAPKRAEPERPFWKHSKSGGLSPAPLPSPPPPLGAPGRRKAGLGSFAPFSATAKSQVTPRAKERKPAAPQGKPRKFTIPKL